MHSFCGYLAGDVESVLQSNTERRLTDVMPMSCRRQTDVMPCSYFVMLRHERRVFRDSARSRGAQRVLRECSEPTQSQHSAAQSATVFALRKCHRRSQSVLMPNIYRSHTVTCA